MCKRQNGIMQNNHISTWTFFLYRIPSFSHAIKIHHVTYAMFGYVFQTLQIQNEAAETNSLLGHRENEYKISMKHVKNWYSQANSCKCRHTISVMAHIAFSVLFLLPAPSTLLRSHPLVSFGTEFPPDTKWIGRMNPLKMLYKYLSLSVL